MADQEQEVPKEGTQLQIVDLQALLQVVDVLSSRGAVKPEEMSAVGAIRDKLATFLSEVPAAAAANETEGTDEDATEAEA